MNSTSDPRIKILRSPQGCASYVISDAGNLACIIDPIADLHEQYIDYLTKANLTLSAVIETHTHADHYSGAPKFKKEMGVDLFVGEKSQSHWATRKVAAGEKIRIGTTEFSVLEIPGHTEDSICLELKAGWGSVLFTGDSLFIGGTGRTDFPGSDSSKLFRGLAALKERKTHFILPGHDYSGQLFSTVGLELETNPQFCLNSESEFIASKSAEIVGVSSSLQSILDYNLGLVQDLPLVAQSCGDSHGTSCSSVAMSFDPISCSVQAAHEALGSGMGIGIDLRDPEEVAKVALPGFLAVPLSELMTSLKKIEQEYEKLKNAPVYLICRTGNTSRMAAATLTRLQSQGIFPKADIYSVEGGATKWRIAGLPTQKS